MKRIPVQQRRELLADAAFRVIARNGMEGATTRAICAEADMALASFHYAFESRDQLLAELVIRGTTDELTTVIAPVSSELPPPEDVDFSSIIRAGLYAYLDALEADPAREHAMIALWQYALRTEGLEQHARTLYERYYALAEEALSAAAQYCSVTFRVPPKDFVPSVIALTDGMTIAYLNTRRRDPAESIIESLVDLVCSHVAQ